jgi:hypothetical protein
VEAGAAAAGENDSLAGVAGHISVCQVMAGPCAHSTGAGVWCLPPAGKVNHR